MVTRASYKSARLVLSVSGFVGQRSSLPQAGQPLLLEQRQLRRAAGDEAQEEADQPVYKGGEGGGEVRHRRQQPGELARLCRAAAGAASCAAEQRLGQG